MVNISGKPKVHASHVRAEADHIILSLYRIRCLPSKSGPAIQNIDVS